MSGLSVAELQEELERVKQIIAQNLGIDLRSPAQKEQADKDAADAEKKAKKADE